MNGNDINDNEYWEQQERQTKELRESLPEDFKAYTAKQIIDYLNSLSSENQAEWLDCIGHNPFLQRVIYYVFSPPEETIGRFRMILTRIENQLQISTRFFADMEYIHFALEQPEIRNNRVLRSFLAKMADELLRILQADVLKLEGSKENIGKLRRNAIARDKNGKLIIDSLRSRIEISRNRIDVYVLDERATGDDTSHFFAVDDLLVRQLQEYDETPLRWEVFDDPMKAYIYDRSGNLIKPPQGYKNPFFFSLRKRYDELIQSKQREWSSRLEEDDVTDAFERSVLTTLSGNPQYIKQRFGWKLLDISKRKERLVGYDETITRPDTEEKNAEELLLMKESELEKSEILALIKQDHRLSEILRTTSRRSETDQKYFSRKRDELIKKVQQSKNKK